jgi:hypothetical protein
MRTPALVVILCAVLVSGCGKKSEPQATPTFDTNVTASAPATPSAAASPSASPSQPGNQGPTYPTNAKAYAQALLAAWGAKDNNRINQLANQAAAQQIADGGNPNNQWNTFVACSPDGNAYTVCTFRNAHGDEVKVRLSNPLLGKPAAATEALMNKTTYPSNAGDYGGEFLDAWRNGNTDRMKRLSGNSVVSTFTGKNQSNGYTIGVEEWGDGTHWKVVFSGLPLGSPGFTLKVHKATLGKASAIVGATH